MDANRLTLEQFHERLERRANKFKAFWLKHHAKDPKEFVSAMHESDWWEQFSAWEDSQ